MAVYTIYCCDLRVGPMYSSDSVTWWCPINCEAVVVDTNGDVVPPDGLDDSMAVMTLQSTEPLEYGDDITDLRRKALGTAWNAVWTQLDPQTDTITEYWIDAV